MALFFNIEQINQEIKRIDNSIKTLEVANEDIFTQNDIDILTERYTQLREKLQACVNIAIANMDVEYQEL